MPLKLETTFRLPSLGKPYENKELAGDIKIKMITGLMEKKIYGTSSPAILDELIEECVVSPKIKAGDLTPDDKQFILIQIRMHSYGYEYHVEGECPSCGYKKDYLSGLDKMGYKEISKDWVEPVEVKLPMAKDTLMVRALRVKDQKIINDRVKRLSKEASVKAAEQEFISTMAQTIVSINGEDKMITEKESYIQNLTSRDLLALKRALKPLTGYGYDGIVHLTCESCGEEFEAPVVLGYEFFHPRLD